MPLTGNRVGSARVTPWAKLQIDQDPTQLLVDTFDTAIDLTQWTINNAGGGVLPAYSGASATLNSGVTANGYSRMLTIPTFGAEEPGWMYWAARLNIEYPVLLTGYRFWGFANTPASPTIANPITDGVGFEIGLNGKLAAVTYAGGVRLLIADLTQAIGLNPQLPAQPQDANAHKYYIWFRPDVSYWAIDDTDNIVASFLTGASGPNVNNLPMQYLCVSNGGTAVTIVNNGCSLGDTARNNVGLSDAVYGWRNQKIMTGGDIPANNAQGSYPQPTMVAPVATTDTPGVAANPNRRGLIVSHFNATATAVLYVLVDPSGAAAASATNYTVVIPANSTWTMPNPVSTARVRVFASVAASEVGITDISAATAVGGA